MRGTADRTNRNKSAFLLSVLDQVLSAVVVAPAIVLYWRGTWSLYDIYVFPEEELMSVITCLIIGFVGQLIFTHTQHYLAENLGPEKNRFVFYLVSRLYTYVYGAICVILWRGIWKGLDIFTGANVVTVLMTTVLSIAFLAVTKILRNISGSPFVLIMDQPEGYFAVPTMFKLMNSKVDSLFILDSLFSVFVVGCLVVFAWRGVWCLFDIYWFPEDETISAAASLVLGYTIVFIVFGIQSRMKKFCEKMSGFWRFAALDLYMFVAFIGTINTWRGIWNLLNVFFFPESPELSHWLTHFGCFAFLVLINCSNSVLVRGVAMDGMEEGGNCTVFPTSFLRTLLNGSKERAMEKPTEETDRSAKEKTDSVV